MEIKRAILINGVAVELEFQANGLDFYVDESQDDKAVIYIVKNNNDKVITVIESEASCGQNMASISTEIKGV